MSDDRNREESRRILDRVSRESDPSQSLLARGADRMKDHMSAADADQNDPIDVVGTRIGRIIAVTALIAFVIWGALYLARGG